jgi:hypothetical protein
VSGAIYIGTKVVHAEPMTRLEYNAYRGWTMPANEDGADAGYLVEYRDGGKANMPDRKGYVSWSPAEVFERSYRLTNDNMAFGEAIEAMKQGCRVQREGWNGKGMWLSISHPKPAVVLAENFWSPNNREYANQQGGYATVLPSITMKTATGEILMGWLASQTDMLAEDWRIVQ